MGQPDFATDSLDTAGVKKDQLLVVKIIVLDHESIMKVDKGEVLIVEHGVFHGSSPRS